jgi:hypothetical protein
MNLIGAYIYNLILLIGIVYLVGWQNWSPWWFLLTMCCAASFSDKK